MNIQFTPNPRKYFALLTCDYETAMELQEMRENDSDWGTSKMEAEVLESLLANSEWDWIQTHETWDLTDAPIIGTRDEQDTVTERYAYMRYQVRSFLDDLADYGNARWEGSK